MVSVTLNDYSPLMGVHYTSLYLLGMLAQKNITRVQSSLDSYFDKFGVNKVPMAKPNKPDMLSLKYTK